MSRERALGAPTHAISGRIGKNGLTKLRALRAQSGPRLDVRRSAPDCRKRQCRPGHVERATYTNSSRQVRTRSARLKRAQRNALGDAQRDPSWRGQSERHERSRSLPRVGKRKKERRALGVRAPARMAPPTPLATLRLQSAIVDADRAGNYGLKSWIEQARKANAEADVVVRGATASDDDAERVFVALRRWAGYAVVSTQGHDQLTCAGSWTSC